MARTVSEVIAAYFEVYQAAEALDLLEDFSQEPCWHDDCAPQDKRSYQEARQRLYDALVVMRRYSPVTEHSGR